ncbi:uncharacterized protein LOC144746255 [Ciona intestinalis]
MASANAKSFPTVIITGMPVNDHVEKLLRNCIDQTIGPTNVVRIKQLGGSYVVAVTDNKYCHALRGADLVVLTVAGNIDLMSNLDKEREILHLVTKMCLSLNKDQDTAVEGISLHLNQYPQQF